MNMTIQKPSFDEKKATGLATYFLQLAGGTINKMKLIKLMYLVDRASLCEMGQFVTNDDLYSLPYGPFLSHVDDLIDKQRQEPSLWDRYITAPKNYNISLTKISPTDVQMSLSEYEQTLADKIYQQYGKMDKWDLVDLLHKILPEWENPGEGNRKPIDIQKILASCGKTPEEQKEIFVYLAEQAQTERFF